MKSKNNRKVKIKQNLFSFSEDFFKTSLFQKVSAQNLGLFRIILGAGLLYEAYRIYNVIPKYYINPELYIKWDFFHFIPVFSPNILYILSFILAIASVLVLVGFVFRFASIVYLIIYVYFILAEASYYNNHYYFIALLLFIIIFTQADKFFSIKQIISKKLNRIETDTIPSWNYFLLRFQVFLAYFIAGIVKLNFDWISTNTFRCVMQYGTEYPKDSAFYHSEFGIYFLTFGGLFFDLLIPIMLLNKKTRIFALPAIFTFHTINAATLNIGVFPYLMAGCTIVFYRNDIVDYWKLLYVHYKQNKTIYIPINAVQCPYTSKGVFSNKIFYSILFYCMLQLFIPFRHKLIPGNVGWTGEGNNFAWRMKMGLKAPSRFDLYVHNKYSGKEYKPTIKINPHQYSSLWICPNRIKQIAEYVANKTSKQFSVSKDSLTVTCKTDLIFNNHPPTPIFDTTVNFLEIKINRFGHSDFITKEPAPYPSNQFYWLSNFID